MKYQELLQLYAQQIQEFELARKNYANLKHVIVRDISCSRFHLRIQYNPARMLSTNAQIDAQTLQNRKCFLCQAHMPEGQQGLRYNDRYHIFINPYPIFEPHFTVPSDKHDLQRIHGRFEDFIGLIADFPELTVFYNGPECGASAPDHFHFQMIPRHLMPLEEDVENEQIRQIIVKKDGYAIFSLSNYLREVLVIQCNNAYILPNLFQKTLQVIGQNIPYEKEPMINLLGWFDHSQWTICLFPRQMRRPWQFYANGEEQILFSPGCVDMAGVIISPREEDFRRYSEKLLANLFGQVTANRQARIALKNELKNL